MTETHAPEQPPIEAPALPYTFKATLKEYRRRLGVGRIILALALTAIFYFRFGLVGWIVSVVGIAAIIAAILYFLSRRRITLREEGVEYTNSFGGKRLVSYGDIEATKVFTSFYEPSFGIVPRVTIGVKNSKNPISLVGLYWHLEDLDKLLAVLKEKDVKEEYYADIASFQMIMAQFPAYATFMERHYVAIAIYTVLAIMLGVTVTVLFQHFVL